MTIGTVGILSPGDMGHVVGQVLRAHGLRVIACLDGRSDRTRRLAGVAGIEAVGTHRDLVIESEVILSILVPAQARQAGDQISCAIEDTRSEVLFADCNAIAPRTSIQIGARIEQAGGRYVDASIIGPPPRKPGTTRFYASGPNLADFEALRSFGLEVVSLGDSVGRASAIKMCYAALTKGQAALSIELLLAAHMLGVYDSLIAEFKISQNATLDRMERQLPGALPKAHRWVGEMEEIASTFAHCGLTPDILQGAAAMYRLVSESSLGGDDSGEGGAGLALNDMIAKFVPANHAP